MVTLFSAVIGALAVLVASWFAVRESKKSQTRDLNWKKAQEAVQERETAAAKVIAEHQHQVEKFRADGEAYERATAFNERLVKSMGTELDRLRKRLADEEARSDALEKQIEQLQKFTDRMVHLLARHNIPLPPEEGPL